MPDHMFLVRTVTGHDVCDRTKAILHAVPIQPGMLITFDNPTAEDLLEVARTERRRVLISEPSTTELPEIVVVDDYLD